MSESAYKSALLDDGRYLLCKVAEKLHMVYIGNIAQRDSEVQMLTGFIDSICKEHMSGSLRQKLFHLEGIVQTVFQTVSAISSDESLDTHLLKLLELYIGIIDDLEDFQGVSLTPVKAEMRSRIHGRMSKRNEAGQAFYDGARRIVTGYGLLTAAQLLQENQSPGADARRSVRREPSKETTLADVFQNTVQSLQNAQAVGDSFDNLVNSITSSLNYQ